MNDKQLVIVLGMHRSGTSLVAGALSFLGCSYDYEMVPSVADDNPKGYWESVDVVAINDKILAAYGLHYIDFERMLDSKADNSSVAVVRTLVDDWVKKSISKDSVVALKDPRLCRTLFFWESSLQKNGVSAVFLHVFRLPGEVVKSLQVRDGSLAEVIGILAWLAYVIESFNHDKNAPSVIVSYKTFLVSPIDASQQIGKILNIKWPINPKLVEENLNLFVDKKLAHQDYSQALPYNLLNDLANNLLALMTQYELKFLDASFYAQLALITDEFNNLRDTLEPLKYQFQAQLKLLNGDLNKQILYRDALIHELENQLINERQNAKDQINYRDALIKELEGQLLAEKVNFKEQVDYRDALAKELEKQLEGEKQNAKEQVDYRDALTKELEKQLEDEKQNAKEQVDYRDALTKELEKQLEDEKQNAKEQVDYRDALTKELEKQLEDEKQNAKEQVDYRDALTKELEKQLEDEKQNAKEQVDYRDALTKKLEKQLKDEKQNAKDQIFYRESLVKDLQLLLDAEKFNARQQVEYRDAMIKELTEKLDNL